jgi:hypothetical protein
MLQPTVSRSDCLGKKNPYKASDQIFITVRQLQVVDMGALSDKRTALSSTIAAGRRQSSHFRL